MRIGSLAYHRDNVIEVEIEIDMRQKPYKIAFGLPDEPMVIAATANITAGELRPWAYLWGQHDSVVLLPRKRRKQPRMEPWRPTVRAPLSYRPAAAPTAAPAAAAAALGKGTTDAHVLAAFAADKFVSVGYAKAPDAAPTGAETDGASSPHGSEGGGPAATATATASKRASKEAGGGASRRASKEGGARRMSSEGGARRMSSEGGARRMSSEGGARRMSRMSSESASREAGASADAEGDAPSEAPPAGGSQAAVASGKSPGGTGRKLVLENRMLSIARRKIVPSMRLPPADYTYFDDPKAKKKEAKRESKSLLLDFSVKAREVLEKHGAAPKRHPWDRARPVTQTYADFWNQQM